MRFKDFEIVIHGDFESGDDELDLRSAIAKKLGGLSAKTSDAEAETVQKIEDGDARWAPPLQQHLDVVKQSLENTENVKENSTQILDLHAARQHYEKYHESQSRKESAILEQRKSITEQISFCGQCGHLVLGKAITEGLDRGKIQRLCEKWAVIAKKYTGGITPCALGKCQPWNHNQ
jgi:hypothetical protein